MVRIRNNNVTMTHEFKISITTIYFSHHLVLFTVKTNGPPLFLGAKLKFHWLTLVPLWFYGHKIFTVFAGLAICRLRIAALCLPASIFGYLLWLEHESKPLWMTLCKLIPKVLPLPILAGPIFWSLGSPESSLLKSH